MRPLDPRTALCQALRLLEGYDLRAMGHLSADYVHVVAESLKLALADRDEYYADPLFADVPLQSLLSDEYTVARRRLINMTSASHVRQPGDPATRAALRSADPPKATPTAIPVQDTTTCVVADRWGNVVAATPSCNMLSNTPGPSGVAQGNRLRCLNTAVAHPNRIQPGKRPRITLTPTLVTKNGRVVAAISVAGGDLQDQTSLNVLLNLVEFGMLPEQAVTSPRFSTNHHENSFDPNPDRSATFGVPGSLTVNREILAAVQTELSRAGTRSKSLPKTSLIR